MRGGARECDRSGAGAETIRPGRRRFDASVLPAAVGGWPIQDERLRDRPVDRPGPRSRDGHETSASEREGDDDRKTPREQKARAKTQT